jgi:chromosome segregation ATPase
VILVYSSIGWLFYHSFSFFLAILEARTAANERDSLRERLRIATDTGLNDRARYEQRIEDLEIELRKVINDFHKIKEPFLFLQKLDNDREELLQQNHLLREQIKAFETKFDEQSFTISQLSQEVNEQKNASAQLRYLSEEAERLLQENQRQLNLKKDEVRTQEEKILRLEKKICMFCTEFQEKNQTKIFLFSWFTRSK